MYVAAEAISSLCEVLSEPKKSLSLSHRFCQCHLCSLGFKKVMSLQPVM